MYEREKKEDETFSKSPTAYAALLDIEGSSDIRLKHIIIMIQLRQR